jgi:micrococcal nuclease
MKKCTLGLLFLALYLSFPGPNGYAGNWAHVRWVNDGDTIVLQDGRRVRYIGINTPEIARADTPAEPYAYAAKRYNLKLFFNKRIRLEFDAEKIDRYGRTLAYIFLSDNTFVNTELLKVGYAFFVPRKPNQRYDQIFLKTQREAMTAGEGMWHNWNEKKGHYTGNRRSKRFHRMTCPYGKKTSPKNRLIFHRRWDAFWEGYAPGKKCSVHP